MNLHLCLNTEHQIGKKNIREKFALDMRLLVNISDVWGMFPRREKTRQTLGERKNSKDRDAQTERKTKRQRAISGEEFSLCPRFHSRDRGLPGR